MKKLRIDKEEIFEIAKVIKLNLPNLKIHLYQKNNKLIIKLPLKIDYFKKKEIEFLIKSKYPQLQLIFEDNP